MSVAHHNQGTRRPGNSTVPMQAAKYRQQGVSLIIALIMLLAVLMLGISATQLSLQGEKASRADRDRQVALQAAEAALMDAQMDIRSSPKNSDRKVIFSEHPLLENFAADCGKGKNNPALGLCQPSSDKANPVWLAVNFDETSDANVRTVEFGQFTGQTMETGKAMMPGKLPRYIIEVISFRAPASSAEPPGGSNTDGDAGQSYVYRITAIGYGQDKAGPLSQAVLQSFYYKLD